MKITTDEVNKREGFKIFKEDEEVLYELSDYLIEILKSKFQALQEDSYYFDALGKNRTLQLGAMLKLSGNGIYNAINKTKRLSPTALAAIDERFKLISKCELYSLEKGDIAFALIEKIKGQPVDYKLERALEQTDDPITTLLLASKWKLYERFIPEMGIRSIEFTLQEDGKKLNVKIGTSKGDRRSWTGEAYFDRLKDVLVILSQDKENTYITNYMFKLDRKAPDITLLIGHMTFLQDINNNIVSKSVILERDTAKEVKPQLVSLASAKKDYPEIYEYLKDRRMNRISSPHSQNISSKKDLKKWQTDNMSNRNKEINEGIFTKWKIYYKKDLKDTPTIDEIEISKNGEVEYTHKVESGGERKWIGEMTFSQKTRNIFIALKDEDDKGPNSQNQSNSIFIILNVPGGYRSLDTLIGIISGVTDDFDTCVGMLIVAIRVGKSANIGVNVDTVVESFFRKYQDKPSILPPKFPIGNISELDEYLKK